MFMNMNFFYYVEKVIIKDHYTIDHNIYRTEIWFESIINKGFNFFLIQFQ